MLTTLIYSLFALDQTLANLAAQHFALMLAALFIVIFAETGLVIFPLLPGDSLLFVSGTVVAATDLNIHLLVVTLFAAAVLGYSVNESVVIADRIRENFRKMRKASVPQVINSAITSTLSRTIITHGCTLMMVLSILFFGGETLHYFALALAICIWFGI